MSDIPKILIAEPIYAGMHPRVYFNRIAFWKSVAAGEYFVDAVDYGPRSPMFEKRTFHTRSLIMGPRKAIRTARADAIREAFKHKATHILFMDDDILVPEDILPLLLQVNQGIVGGLMNRDDDRPIVFKDVPGGEDFWEDHPKDYAFECAAVAAGCMLVKMEVFRSVLKRRPGDKFPFFFNYDETHRSMDVLFCRKARESGHQVWCLPNPPCEQIKHY